MTEHYLVEYGGYALSFEYADMKLEKKIDMVVKKLQQGKRKKFQKFEMIAGFSYKARLKDSKFLDMILDAELCRTDQYGYYKQKHDLFLRSERVAEANFRCTEHNHVKIEMILKQYE